MGSRLMTWASNQDGLSEKDFRVLLAMCMVAHDDHGRYFLNVHTFLKNYFKTHRIRTHSSLRNHLASLADKGYIGRIRKGNGKHQRKRGSQTEYQILAVDVLPAEAFRDYETAAARRGDRRRPLLQGRLRTFVSMDGGASESTNVRSSADIQDRQDVRSSADIQDRQDVRSSADIQDRQDVRSSADIQDARMSGPNGHPKAHDYKDNNYKGAATAKDAAAASPSFFDDIASACAEKNIRGVRPSLFDFRRLRDELAACPRALSFDDALWVADEMRLANRRDKIRNPEGFLIDIVSKLFKNGSTRVYIAEEPEKEDWRKEHERREEWRRSLSDDEIADIAGGS